MCHSVGGAASSMLAVVSGNMLPVKPQQRTDFLRQREGQTVNYGLRKVLRCTARKTTRVILNYFFAPGICRVFVGVCWVCARLGADGYLRLSLMS